MNVYRTLMRTVTMFAMATTAINKKQEEDLRTILGPSITDKGDTRRKAKAEIEEALNQADIARQIKTLRLVGRIYNEKNFRRNN